MNYVTIDSTGRVVAVGNSPDLLPDAIGVQKIAAPGFSEHELKHYYWNGSELALRGPNPITGPGAGLAVGDFATFNNIPAATNVSVREPDGENDFETLSGSTWQLLLSKEGRYVVVFEPAAFERLTVRFDVVA